MATYFSFLKAKPLYTTVGILAVLAVGYAVFFRTGGPAEELLVVHPGDFLQQVSVSGKVVSAQEVDLGFSQGGRVAGVYVKVGQKVSVGTTLASIENGDLRAGVLQKQAALETQQAKLASLKAGTRPEEVAVSESEVASAAAALVNAIQDAYRAADASVRNTTDQFLNNPRTNPQLTFPVSDSQLKAKVETERSSAEVLLTSWQSAVLGLTADSDLAVASQSGQKNLSQIAALLSDANVALNHGISSPSIPQATLDGYISAVATARANINTAISALSSGVTTLDTAKKNLALAKAGATAEDIASQEAQVNVAKADLANAQALLAKTIITAPFSGTVTLVDAKVGSIASSNATQISLIAADSLQIESYVPEINVAVITVEDGATATLDAYGESTPFEAKVVSVDPAETVRDGVSTYKTILQFLSQDARIRSGMTANVVITTDKREGVLSVPQGIIVERDGKKYVQTKTSDAMVEREVTTGEVSSSGNIEILSGLSDGDVVVLSGK